MYYYFIQIIGGRVGGWLWRVMEGCFFLWRSIQKKKDCFKKLFKNRDVLQPPVSVTAALKRK